MNLKIFGIILHKIKITKISKILNINQNFFFDLLIFHFSKIFRGNVDDNLIILGAANGKAFIGNPKYLYYYLKKNTNYNLIWFSKSERLTRELRKKGINTINAYSLEGIKILKKARAVFVSHGWGDILPIKFPPRTVVVQTWHGGFIKIKGKHPYITKYINSKWTTLTRLKIRYYQFFNYVISSSNDDKLLTIASDVFKFPKERIIVTGFPRNDILFSNQLNLLKKLKENYNIPKSIKRIILYAPTYRELIHTRDPFNDEDLFELNELCVKTDTIFLMKAHINEEIISLKNFKNIKRVGKYSDIQELLLISDILVTDYSSVVCDFLLLERPILLYTYDYNDYIGNRGIYYNSLDEIAPGPILFTVEQLIKAITNIDEIKLKYRHKLIEVRDFFNKYKDGKASKRLLEFLRLV